MSKQELIRTLLDLGIGTKTTLSSASYSTLESFVKTGSYEVLPYNIFYKDLLAGGKAREMTAFYNWMKLNSVRFPMPSVTYDQFQDNTNGVLRSSKTWGEVDYFLSELKSKLGDDWATKVLSVKYNSVTKKDEPVYNLSGIKGVKRLGVPGRQGTVIKLSFNDIDYAIKVAAKTTSCGDGATGGMGYLKQARLQQIAAEWGVTCPVYAVHCVPGKKEAPFMAMPMMGERMVDIYGSKEWSEDHQKQFWNLRLLLDTHVGLVHNDGNCLNVMTDKHNVVKLIDFDRSYLMDHKHVKKYGLYNNLCFLPWHKCFTRDTGKLLRKAMERLFPLSAKERNPSLGVKYFNHGPCTKADSAGAIFFEPFSIPKPTIATFPPQVSEVDALKIFCKDSSNTNWNKLSIAVIGNLTVVADYCIARNKGNVQLARKIQGYLSSSQLSPKSSSMVDSSDWYVEVGTDTKLYNRSFSDVPNLKKNSPQWFAFEKGYGSPDTYGPNIFTYIPSRPLKVIDMGKKVVRNDVGIFADSNSITPITGCRGMSAVNVIERAWGEGCNTPAAEIVCKVCEILRLDGWIAKDWDDEDMEGPEEIMLCNAAEVLKNT